MSDNHHAHLDEALEPWHIASLVAHCRPENITSAIAAIESVQGQEVPERDENGKLIVVIESRDEIQLLEAIRAIEQLPGMISTSLVYHQIDT